jgi:hypothetical protein
MIPASLRASATAATGRPRRSASRRAQSIIGREVRTRHIVDSVADGRRPPLHENASATPTRSAAARAGLRREIDSQAGWIERRPVVEMAPPVIVIRRLTDERRTQTRVASARVRGLRQPANRPEPL